MPLNLEKNKMEESSPSKKDERKPGSKLSLQKKTRLTKAEKNKVHGAPATISLVDLNETCEFKDGKSLSTLSAFRYTKRDPGSDSGASVDETAPATCQVCQKNLSHMNTQRQQQHVNRCIDKLEEKEQKERAEKQALDTARTATLDCPLCGQKLNTEQSRTSHLKKCSQQLGVSTEKMLQLVKAQEDERQLMVSAGVIPPAVKSRIKSTDGQKAGKKRTAKEPKSKFDEDVQIAMAISSSIADQDIMARGDLIGQLNQPENSGQEKKKSRKKKNPEEPCQLLALSHADRQKRLADKVNSIFHTEDVYEGSEQPKKLFQTKLHSSTDTGHLWNKAVTIEDEERDQFYVKALMPHVQVSGAQTGHNFKRLSSIPGREKSFVGEKVGEQPKTTGPADDIFTASTQTAVVLAELAVDTDDPLSQTLADDLNATGFLIEEDTLALEDDESNKEREKLGACMKSLVNNPMYSDIKLVSSDGQKLFAHKIIVATRCPRLIKDDKWREINIPLSSKSALALLNYLYTGELTMTASIQSELIGFSERLGLDDFMDLCQKVKPLNEVDEKVNVKQEDENHVDDIEDLNKTRLDVMLKEVWGESDSESEGSDNDNEKIDEGLTEQDYQDIRSSQRHKLKHHEEDGEQTESSDDSAVTDLEENVVHKDASHVEQDSSELAKTGSDGEHKTTSKHTIDAVEMISECDDNDFNSPKEDLEDDYHENTSDDDVLVVDVKQDTFANNGAKHVLNLKRTRQANTGSNKSPRICVEIGDNDVNVDNNHVHNYQKITDSPSSKRIRLSCDTNVKSSVNTENAVKTGNISATDINMDSPVTSFKKLSREQSKKDLEKSNVAYCGLSFDASFSQTKQSKEDSRSSFGSAPGSASKLDSSATDLFGSPSPRKPLFKPSQKGSPSPKRSLFKPSQKEGISPKKYTFKPSKKETEVVIHSKDNENEPNDSNREMKEIDENMNQSTYSADQKDKEAKKIHLSQGSNEFSDDDIEITGYDFMETSQCSAKVEDAKCENRSLTKEASGMLDTTWPENNRDMDDLEITGDNFDQIASQNSPKFEKTKLKHKEDNFSNPVMRESKELDDKSTRILVKNVEMNSSVRKVTENSEDNHVSQINDLESYDFNESFNESFNDSAIVSYELDVKNTSDNDNLAVGNTNSSFCDISNANDNKLKDGNAGRNTTSSEVVRIASDSSNSSPETHCSKVTEAKVIETREVKEAEEIACDIGDTSTGANHAVDDDGNVWDDFEEDYGYADIISSQEEQLENKDSDVDADIDTADDNEADCQSPAVSETQRKITVPLSKENKKASFKTPSVSQGQGKKPWAVPSPFTPMPSYDNMNTPMLKKAVQKFGVKPVGKKRMVKVLKDIYQQTHQYETDSDYEEDSDKNSNTVTMTTVVKVPRNCTVTTTTRVRTVGERIAMETADSAEVDDFPSSQDISSSQESDVSDLLEETCIHPPSDDSDVSSSPQKGVDLTKQLTDYIHRNRELKIKMLMYEPIELDVFKKDLKEAGIKCSMDKVMEFLDERCLAFTTKNQRKRPTRGRKKTSKQPNKS